MPDKMTVAQAIDIAKAVASAVRKWGRHASPPYTNAQLMTAVDVLVANASLDTEATSGQLAECREALTAANRRVAAANARVARLTKKKEAESV